jgi:hypothetical protein
VLPLLVGLAELGFFVVRGRQLSIDAETQAFVSGFLLIIVGLVIAGPWLTMAMARIMARRTSHASALIAARRLSDDPRGAFRAVSGLVLALFVTTVAVVAITTQDAEDGTQVSSGAAANVLTDQFAGQQQFSSTSGGSPGSAAPAASLSAQLRGIAGVQGVVVVRAAAKLTVPGALIGYNPGPPGTGPAPAPAGVVSCAQLATVPTLGRCPAGATVAAFPESGFEVNGYGTATAGITWPAANVPASRLETLGVDTINVATDGSVPAVERARTVLENAYPHLGFGAPSTIGELDAVDDTVNNAYQQLANVVILVSLPIAGCTLAASIAAGLADRKRPFSLLRLTGAPLAMLRRVVALESAVPLLAVAAVAIGTGFAAAAEYASVAQHHSVVAPGVGYYLLTAGGILVSLGIIAATFPLLTRITGPEVARNE